ncbi:MAG: DNA methyltransferase, partial [Candidatus Hodarchaeales archaeon]
MVEFRLVDHALVAKGHQSMYLVHKYFGRKSWNIVSTYIKNHSNEGELILDPFCGSGVVVAESLKFKRNAIGIDINPVAIFISKNTISNLDVDDIRNKFVKLQVLLKESLNSLYQTKCRVCGNNVFAICFTWKKDELVDVRYECPQHGKRIDPVNQDDLSLYEKIVQGELLDFFTEDGVCLYWYPKDKLFYDNNIPFLKKEHYDSVEELYTLRNKIALAKLYNYIINIEDLALREAFLYSFSSITHLASKMTPVRPSRPFSSSWVQQSYWYCKNFMESNVWFLFDRAINGKQGLIKAKAEINAKLPNTKYFKNVKEFYTESEKSSNNYLLLNNSINQISSLRENSIDYIFTDPPYGFSIQYGELLFLWASWLK